MTKQVTVWVCPREECGNYYGASSAEGLSDQVNRRTAMRNSAQEDPKEWGGITGTRDECPDCKAAGRGVVHRRPTTVTLAVPDAEPEVAA